MVLVLVWSGGRRCRRRATISGVSVAAAVVAVRVRAIEAAVPVLLGWLGGVRLLVRRRIRVWLRPLLFGRVIIPVIMRVRGIVAGLWLRAASLSGLPRT